MAALKIRKTYFWVTLSLLGIIGLHYLGITTPLEAGLQLVLNSFFSRAYSFSVRTGETYQFFTSRQNFLDAYTACSNQVQNQATLEAKNKLLEEENSELKKILHFTKNQTSTILIAEVIGATNEGNERSILINKGSRDGVAVNQAVVAGEGAFVGTITKTGFHTATIRLLSDTQSKIAATVLNNERSLGVVESGYGINLKMKFIPRNEIVLVGNQIVTSGLESPLPRGLLIGTVATVENEAYQSFQEAILTPAVNLSKLTLVEVLVADP